VSTFDVLFASNTGLEMKSMMEEEGHR